MRGVSRLDVARSSAQITSLLRWSLSGASLRGGEPDAERHRRLNGPRGLQPHASYLCWDTRGSIEMNKNTNDKHNIHFWDPT